VSASVSVEVNGDAAERMLARIQDGLRFTQATYRVAQDGVAQIGAIARDTGALAGSLRAKRTSSPTMSLIVSDVPYARFVFRGTRHMAAQPPDVPTEALASELVREINREIFK
jgi:hypothetical protein